MAARATIDGQGVHKTVDLHTTDWVDRGIVARNGTDNVFRVDGSITMLRRVSAYDASDDINSSVIACSWGRQPPGRCIGGGHGALTWPKSLAGTAYVPARVRHVERLERTRFLRCGVAEREQRWRVQRQRLDGGKRRAYGRSLKEHSGAVQQRRRDFLNNHRAGVPSPCCKGRNYDGSVDHRTGQQQPTAQPGPTTCTGITSWGWLAAQRYRMGLYGRGTIGQRLPRRSGGKSRGRWGSPCGLCGRRTGGNVIKRGLVGNGLALTGNRRRRAQHLRQHRDGCVITVSVASQRLEWPGGQARLQRYDRQGGRTPLRPGRWKGRAVARWA